MKNHINHIKVEKMNQVFLCSLWKLKNMNYIEENRRGVTLDHFIQIFE